MTPSTGIIFFKSLLSMLLGKGVCVDILVSIDAGHTQFTLTPCTPYSTAKVLENALMPPFEALYAAVQACEPRAAVDETFTIEPVDSIIKGRAYLHIKNVPVKFTSRIFCQSFSSTSLE